MEPTFRIFRPPQVEAGQAIDQCGALLVSIKADPHVFSAPTVGSTDTLPRQHNFSYIAIGIASQLGVLSFSHLRFFSSHQLPLRQDPSCQEPLPSRARHIALSLLRLFLSFFQDARFFSGGLCAADRGSSRGLSHRQRTSDGPGYKNCPKVLHYQHGMLTHRSPSTCHRQDIDNPI